MEVLEKEIRSKEEIIREIQWFKSGLSTIEEMLNETNLKLDKLHDELAEAEKKSEAWKPKFNERYWCVDRSSVTAFYWEDDSTDNWKYSTNNCFKTEEEAERRKFELELEGKARLFQLENNEVIDWEDRDKEKFYIYYNPQLKVIGTDWCVTKSANKLGYFSSRELAKRFVEENKEDLIKYFKGLK